MGNASSGKSLAIRLAPLYERLQHPEAHLSGRPAAAHNSVRNLADAKYLLLESERVDGTPISTPMCFAAVDDTIFLPTEATSPKVQRIRRRPIVKVAPCTVRGLPTGDHIECLARIVPREQDARAEVALRRSYGALWRLFRRFACGGYVYLELKPLAQGKPVPEDQALAMGVRAVREARETPTDAA